MQQAESATSPEQEGTTMIPTFLASRQTQAHSGRRLIVRALITGAVALATLLPAGPWSGHAARVLAATPTVTLTPAQGPAGSATEVSACGFIPPPGFTVQSQGFTISGITLVITFDFAPVQSVTNITRCADGSYGFAQPVLISIPSQASVGLHLIGVSWDVSRQRWDVPFTVVAMTPPAASTVINFDDVPANGAIAGDRYHNLGVDIEAHYMGAVTLNPAGYAGGAASGTQAANVWSAQGEIRSALLHGTFTSLHQHLWVYVGDLAMPTILRPINGPQVILTAYDTDHNIVAIAQTQIHTSGVGARIEVDAASPSIASFDLSAPSLTTEMAIDDLSFDQVATLVPDFSLSGDSTVYLWQSQSRDTTIHVQRFNGSSGPLRYSVAGLPSGVSATFSANPTDANTVTLTLAATGSAATSTGTITVTATPVDQSSGTLPHSLTMILGVEQSYYIRTTTLGVQPCATAQEMLVLGVPTQGSHSGQFNGPITLSVDNAPPNVSVTIKPSVVSLQNSPNADATLSVQTVTSTPGNPVILAHQTLLIIHGTSPGVLDQLAAVVIYPTPPTVSAVKPSVGRTPQALQPGTEVTISGQGFCQHGTTVEFGNVNAVATPDYVSPDGTTLRVAVPRLATSGPLTILTSGGAPSLPTAPFTVQSYRNTYGFSMHNFPVDGISFGDVTDTFGEGQTYDSVDICDVFTLGAAKCRIQVRDPLAMAFTSVVDSALTGSDSGYCYGFSVASDRFRTSLEPLSSYAPGNANSAWLLTGPHAASPELTHFFKTLAISQFSAEFMRAWALQVAGNVFASPGDIRSQVRSALASGHYPLVALRQGTSGHVVLAYDVEDLGPNDYYIDVYDSNAPFTVGENLSAGGHQSAEQGSRIHVTPDGHWFFGDGLNWTGGFSSLDNSLVVLPADTAPVHPTLPTTINGIATLVFGRPAKAPSVAVSDVVDARGQSLLGGTQRFQAPSASRRLPRAVRLAFVGVPNDSVYVDGTAPVTETLRGLANGAYNATLFGRGMAVRLNGVPSAPGYSDTLGINPSMTQLSFRSGVARKPLDATLVARLSDGSVRSMTLRTTSYAAGSDSIAYDRATNAVIYRHNGPSVTYTLGLSTQSRTTAPATANAPSLSIGSGETATIQPSDWRHLGTATVKVTLIHRNGTRSTHLFRGGRLLCKRCH